MLVTFHNVSVKYLDKIILNKVSFTINENLKDARLSFEQIREKKFLNKN